MTTPTWPQITSAAASLSTVGGAHQIVAAALLHDHRSLNQPESEHEMGSNDIGEQLAAAIETNIGAEAVIANALAIAEAFVDDGYKPGRTIWAIKDALAQRPSIALEEHDRALTAEHTALLAQVAAVRAVIATEGNQHEDERNGDTWINRDALNAILTQPSETTLADGDQCTALHPVVGNGTRCRYLVGHLDADLPHTTPNGFYWTEAPTIGASE